MSEVLGIKPEVPGFLRERAEEYGRRVAAGQVAMSQMGPVSPDQAPPAEKSWSILLGCSDGSYHWTGKAPTFAHAHAKALQAAREDGRAVVSLEGWESL